MKPLLTRDELFNLFSVAVGERLAELVTPPDRLAPNPLV